MKQNMTGIVLSDRCHCGNFLKRKDYKVKSIYYCDNCGEYRIEDICCDHEWYYTLFELENGTKQLRKICIHCDKRNPKIYSQKEVALDCIETEIEAEYQHKQIWLVEKDRTIYSELIDELNKLKQQKYFQGYYDYINSSKWQDKRQIILKRDNHICRICGNAGNNVHHLSYAHFGNEYDFELVTLCEDCHMNKYHSKEVENKVKRLDIPKNPIT